MSQDLPDKKPPPLEPRIQAHLGDQLRQYYGAMLAEPVPDRFKALLEELERAQPPSSGSKEESR